MDTTISLGPDFFNFSFFPCPVFRVFGVGEDELIIAHALLETSLG